MTVSLRIADRLTSANDLLSAIMARADIQAALAPHGYDQARLQEGQALYAAVLAQHQQQQEMRSAMLAAHAAQTAAQAQAAADYAYCATIARAVFRTNRAALARLALDGRREQAFAAWLLQVRQFYTSALNDPVIGQALNGCGISQARLEAGLQQLAALQDCRATYLERQRAARLMTRQRDQALHTLELWLSDLRVIARRVLRDQPAYLEVLGLGRKAREGSATPITSAPVTAARGQAMRIPGAAAVHTNGAGAVPPQALADLVELPPTV